MPLAEPAEYDLRRFRYPRLRLCPGMPHCHSDTHECARPGHDEASKSPSRKKRQRLRGNRLGCLPDCLSAPWRRTAPCSPQWGSQTSTWREARGLAGG
eukprot:4127781-Pyramimonas_sp.AAC.1